MNYTPKAGSFVQPEGCFLCLTTSNNLCHFFYIKKSKLHIVNNINDNWCFFITKQIIGENMKKYVYVFLLLFFPLISYALDVFRMDTRSPFGSNGIFQNGFQSLGNNRDLYAHVNGSTCFSGSSDSYFISTSSYEPFSTSLGPTDVGTTFYVYRIRASYNFYNVYESLMHAYEDTGIEEFRNLANDYEGEEEYAATSTIDPSQIIDVSEFVSTGDNEDPTFVVGYSNPNYIPSDNRQPNPNPFHFVHNPPYDLSVCSICLQEAASLYKHTPTISDFINCKRKDIATLMFR